MRDELLSIADRLNAEKAVDGFSAGRLQAIEDDLRALAGRSVAVPDGWVMVPRMSNTAMEDAGLSQIPPLPIKIKQERRNAMAKAYDAMLAAAPPPPAAQPIAHGDSEREDAERWREVARRYDASKTPDAVAVLRGLGLEETPYRSLAENIDAARATDRAKGDCDA